MKKLLPFLVLLLPSLAAAQGVWPPETFTSRGEGFNPTNRAGRVALFAPLTTPGCFASPYTSGNLTVTFARATPGNSSDNSQSCAVNEVTAESDGISSWHGATNYVLNSATHPKAAEAVGSITNAAIPFAVWAEGSGTFSVAAGTATLSANTCATPVAVGTTCSITVSVTGSPTVTTSAGVTHLQIEPQIGASSNFPSPRIVTAGAPVSRNAPMHNITTAINALNLWQTNRWCVSVTGKPYRPWGVPGHIGVAWTFGNTSSAANTAGLSTSAGNLIFGINDSATLANSVTWGITGLADGSAHRLTACNASGTPILCVDGTRVSSSVTLNGTGLWNANPATSTLANNTAQIRQWDGDVSNFKVCVGATRCSDCP